MIRIIVKEKYDLDLTMFPSFVSALFTKIENNVWLKKHGSFKGLILKFKGDALESNITNANIIYNLSGLWFNPWFHVKNLSRNTRKIVEEILEFYEGLRLAIDPYDREIIFLATVLSQRTDYHMNVIKWIQKIMMKIDNVRDLIKTKISSISKSYQLIKAEEAVRECFSIIRKDSIYSNNIWTLRKRILKCKYVGPKTTDAYLLFTRPISYIAPIDVHYIRFVKKLKLLKFKKKPVKKLCINYSCDECPLNNECLEAISIDKFNGLSGWIQTVAYVHDKMFCSKRKCDICFLKNLCYSHNL